MRQPQLNLKGFDYRELFDHAGLQRLDGVFLAQLQSINASLYQQLLAYRQGGLPLNKETSWMLVDCAQVLEAFLAELFGIEDAAQALQDEILSDNPVFAFKQHFIQKLARRQLLKADPATIDFQALDKWLLNQLELHGLFSTDKELMVAQLGQHYLEQQKHEAESEQLVQWCVAAMLTEEGRQATADWSSLHLPEKLDYENLVHVEPVPDDAFARLETVDKEIRQRDGFQLTDPRMSERDVLDEVHYCVYCHKNEGDYCSKGFQVKKNDPKQGFKKSPLGETLTGCPLDQKISEMNILKRDGFNLGALAMIMIDNPMCPATGHRICNDCMKACIYQKQEPVNIPEIETRCLTDVLDLPWGVEIYDLLTRWNPLRNTQPILKPYNGKKVMVMGMGPAGFTMAHHLLMEGFAVVGTEGLKIEPLAERLLQPIYSYDDLVENLDERVMTGFGGVAEYGITVRWDKNFLKLIYISLMRHKHFQLVGSIRFGGTLTIEDAWELGFNHLVVAVGAGLPRELRVPNSMVPGMRQANDFLMALQLTGAAKSTSLANLQVRLPAIVIGGGLTGVDTATEVQVYYIKQIEKIAYRYHRLVEVIEESELRREFSRQSLIILDEFLEHAGQAKQERELAAKEYREPNFNRLVRSWGGVTIVYRRTMQESPAYKRNHEELIKALEEGIYYAEGLEPHDIRTDEFGQASGLVCRGRILDEQGDWVFTDEEQILPANAIFVATGAKPNVAYAFEHKGNLDRQGFEYKRFEMVENELERVEQVGHVKMDNFGPFASYAKDSYNVSFIGDTHPIFHGSVVKAIASAKRAYPKIVQVLNQNQAVGNGAEYQKFHQAIEEQFRSTVVAVKRHTDTVLELVVRAPLAARNFHPGQFYRLQNYETNSKLLLNTTLQTEALALLGVDCPDNPDHLRFFVLERGASSRLVATLQPKERVAVMGPTGAKSIIPSEPGEVFLFVGGPLCAIHLLSHGRELRKAGHKLIYMAPIETMNELFCQAELESVTDVIIWVTPEGQTEWVQPNREQDRVTDNELIVALREQAPYLEECGLALPNVSCVTVIGHSHLLRNLQKARLGLLQGYFSDEVKFIASVHGPMQCMLKGVCAQCLQWQVDPITGERTKAVYACSWQNQPMEIVDIDNLDERLAQNEAQETLTNLWLDYVFEHQPVERV